MKNFLSSASGAHFDLRDDPTRLFSWSRAIRVVFVLLVASLVSGPELTPAGAQLVVSGNPEPCPPLPVTITSLSITPTRPAASHVVEIRWSATAPQCFTIDGFKITGVVSFADGQVSGFERTAAATQSRVEIQVPGSLDLSHIPRKVSVSVQATASAIASGAASAPGLSLIATPACQLAIPLQITQSAFDGLQPAPGRPGHDFFPKVRVDWRTDQLPPCLRILHFDLTVKVTFSGKAAQKTSRQDGLLRSAVVVIDSIAVGADAAPDSVSAEVKASGKATISGAVRRESQVD